MRLLVPVDGSAGSLAALRIALDLASATGADVTVLQVIESEEPLPTYDDRPPAGADRVSFLANRRFASLRAPLESTGVHWTHRVEVGVASDRICAVAADERSDLIVIGHRGLSPVGRLLLGSVSDHVAKHAPCSVLIARAASHTQS